MQLWEGSFATFLVLSLVLGGSAALVTGRSVARAWRPLPLALFYVLLLAAGVRFLHFAIGEGTLVAPDYYLVDVVIEGAAATFGYLSTRAGQMGRQYGWLYRRNGPVSWSRTSAPPRE